MSKKKKKMIIGGASALVVVTVVATLLLNVVGASGVPTVRTSEVMRGALRETVNVTGTVYSMQTAEVYAPLNYTIQSVEVQVGDRVEEGDVLAVLDTTQLEYEIAQARATLGAQQSSAQQKVQSAERELSTYDQTTQNGYNDTVLRAESGVQSAQLGVEAASSALWAARREYRETKEEEGGLTDLEATKWRNEIIQLEQKLEQAQATLEQSERELEAAKVGSATSRESYEDQLKSAQVANNFTDQAIAIQKLENMLQDGSVVAPMSGVVTEVKAVQGAPASGLMFVIQDPDHLKVVTNIKEYDIQNVSLGDLVDIKSDATGDEVFMGTLYSIAPTTTQGTTGERIDTSDAEFETEIQVENTGGMRIGMNARLEIVTAEQQQTLYIPYDAIVDDENGAHVYVLRSASDGSYTVHMVSITTGLETDFYSEIFSDQLQEGDIVALETWELADGIAVAPAPGSPAPQSTEPAADDAAAA